MNVMPVSASYTIAEYKCAPSFVIWRIFCFGQSKFQVHLYYTYNMHSIGELKFALGSVSLWLFAFACTLIYIDRMFDLQWVESDSLSKPSKVHSYCERDRDGK